MSYKNNSATYLRKKIKEYSTSTTNPCSHIDAFMGAVVKGYKKQYQVNELDHSVNTALAMSGYANNEPKVTITFRGNDNSEPVQIGSGISENASFDNHNDCSSFFHISGDHTHVPDAGTMNINIQASVDGLEPIDAHIRKAYDFPLSEDLDKDVVEGNNMIIRIPLTTPEITQNNKEARLPVSSLILHMSKDLQNKYKINQAKICTNFDGEDHEHIGSCCPYKRDYHRDRRSCFAPVLLPNRCGHKQFTYQKKHVSSFESEVTKFISSYNRGHTKVSLSVSKHQKQIYEHDSDMQLLSGN